MTTKNPFEVLGLDPKLVARLKPRQLDQLISSTGRTLKAFYHTDQADGGDIERFYEINNASQALDKKQVGVAKFDEVKKQFLKKSARDKVNKLSEELEAEQIATRKLSKAFLNFLTSEVADEGNTPNIHNMTGYRVSIIDNVMSTVSNALKSDPHGNYLFFHLDFTTDGNYRVSEKGKKREAYTRTIVATIPTKSFNRFGGLVNFLTQDAIPPDRQLTHRGRKADRSESILKEMLIQRRYLGYEFEPSAMQKILSNLSTEVVRDNALITLINTPNGPRFRIEGTIVKVERIS